MNVPSQFDKAWSKLRECLNEYPPDKNVLLINPNYCPFKLEYFEEMGGYVIVEDKNKNPEFNNRTSIR